MMIRTCACISSHLGRVHAKRQQTLKFDKL